jgi:hypothetical protein
MADMKAVKFDHYGDVNVLEVHQVPRPSPSQLVQAFSGSAPMSDSGSTSMI